MLFEDFLLSKDIIKFIFEKSLKFLQDIPFFGMIDLKIYFFYIFNDFGAEII